MRFCVHHDSWAPLPWQLRATATLCPAWTALLVGLHGAAIGDSRPLPRLSSRDHGAARAELFSSSAGGSPEPRLQAISQGEKRVYPSRAVARGPSRSLVSLCAVHSRPGATAQSESIGSASRKCTKRFTACKVLRACGYHHLPAGVLDVRRPVCPSDQTLHRLQGDKR